MRLNINPILNTLGEEGMTAHLHNNYCSRAKEKSTNKPYSSHSHVYIHISGNSNGNMILMCRMSLEGHACGDSMRRCVRGGARDRFLVMLPRPGMKTVLVSLVSLNTNPSLTTKMRDEGKRKSERTSTKPESFHGLLELGDDVLMAWIEIIGVSIEGKPAKVSISRFALSHLLLLALNVNVIHHTD